METVPVQVRLRILAGQVYAAAEMGMWGFDPDGHLYYSTSPNEEEFRTFLEIGGCLEYANRQPGGCDRPVYLSTPVGLMWIAEHMYEDGKPSLLVLMGPFFPSRTSMKTIEENLRKMDLTLGVRFRLMRILAKVPFIMLRMANQYARMLHFCLTEQTIAITDIRMQSEDIRKQFLRESQEGEEEPLQNTADSERVIRDEAVLLQMIEQGNTDYQAQMSRMEEIGDWLSDTGNALRDGKNSMIVFSSLSCRSAIRGGVPAKTAKMLEADYINRIEQCTTMTQLVQIRKELMEELTGRVKAIRSRPDTSSAVQKACDYIRANVTNELTLENIAAEAGYTSYYFAKKFQQETGLKINDYIKEARIDYARILLVTTQQSIQEISDSLHFGNRNYFSRVFREVTGTTPAAYRESARKGGKL